MQQISQKPVSLCLHAIQDPADGESTIVISALSVPLVHVSGLEPAPGADNAPYLYSYKYYDNEGNLLGTSEPDLYSSVLEQHLFWIPVAQWTHPSRYYYIVNATPRDLGESIDYPTLMCHSDNGSVIVIEDELDFIEKINNSPYPSHIFTNLKPNEQGCVNLKIDLPTLTSNMWAIVSYYVPDVNNHFPQTLVRQQFPIHLLSEEANIKECRLGFKAFYKDNPIHITHTTGVLPMVWVYFQEDPIPIPPRKPKN